MPPMNDSPSKRRHGVGVGFSVVDVIGDTVVVFGAIVVDGTGVVDVVLGVGVVDVVDEFGAVSKISEEKSIKNILDSFREIL